MWFTPSRLWLTSIWVHFLSATFDRNLLVKVAFFPKEVDTEIVLLRWIQTAGVCFPNLVAFSPVIMWRTLARPLWLKLSGKTSKETRQCSPKVGIVLKSFLFINGRSSGCSKAVTQLAGGVAVLSSTHPTVPVRKIRMYKVPQTKSVFILPYFLMDWKFYDLVAWTKKQLEQVLEPPGDPYHGFYSLVLLHKIDLFKRHLNMIIDVRISVGIYSFYVKLKSFM